MDEFESLSHSRWECKYHVQGNRMNAFIMYLAGICPQPTSQTLSTPSLLVGFFGRHHGKRRPAAAGRVFIS